jgi:hypothetical protein
MWRSDETSRLKQNKIAETSFGGDEKISKKATRKSYRRWEEAWGWKHAND